MKKYLPTILIIGTIVVVIGLIFYAKSRPGQYDNLARCLKDKGAIFYGAFWCSHCQDQKAEFGKSAKLLPYTECSTPDGKGQLPVCNDVGISSYPTWVFSNGEKTSRVFTPQELADKTGCPLN
ncbi:MAG: hypothetical protein A3J93_01960 [Candidatus Magasanikbacteria bacterium RIFOXYC2_FULL_42_28]|uniref:Thioredoxin domain-containing protein n=1 Tax=Candidatus Magasanikbacteria bacterium RIFOXYC2_FULL_42_28 TaxID=1798704 RepID=A0A1F6NWG0_9BACT|nr:MAG: hypothetical protein A3J93_01960 [Candidatus Magasanikbacteria bacterium RIFOXYC2_FULL_42_28]